MQTDPWNAVTIDSLRSIDLEAIVQGIDELSYENLAAAFFDAASSTECQSTQSDGFLLLANICTLKIDPRSANEPFVPIWRGADGRHSFSADSLSPANLALLAEFVDEIKTPLILSRIADLVWTLPARKDQKYAAIAIDAYRKVPLEPQSWHCLGNDCWARAIFLTRLLRRGAGNRLSELETEIVKVLESSTQDEGYFICQLAELCLEFNLGRSQSNRIAQKLEHTARGLNQSCYVKSRSYFNAASKFYERCKEADKAIDMIVCEAESFALEAQNSPLKVLARSLYANAVQRLRSIPGKSRVARGVDDLIQQLSLEMRNAGELGLHEISMANAPIKAIDVSEVVSGAEERMSGLSFDQALQRFATIYDGANHEKLRSTAKKYLERSPLSGLFGGTYFSRDGRVTAKTSPIGFDDTNSDDYERRLLEKMLWSYQSELDLMVKSSILPALRVLILEHRIREWDMRELAKASPLVPLDRAGLVGLALHYGFEGNFAAALYLLTPQIENMVRIQLRAREIKTSTLDIRGIETEIGLSALMDIPEAREVFGDDLTFELKAIFCDPVGPNLRNNVAHGLLSDSDSRGIFAVYAWWFGFKLVFNTFEHATVD
jgi:Domain of unknown function (DUF4209)